MSTPAVAETAALLAAAEPGNTPPSPEALLVEKHRHRGVDGRNATIAVARIGEPQTTHPKKSIGRPGAVAVGG